MIEDLAQVLKNEGIVEEITDITDKEIIFELKNCSYLDLARKAEGHGEKRCPIYLVTLAASIAATVVKNVSFN